jgi:hypothetical protein
MEASQNPTPDAPQDAAPPPESPYRNLWAPLVIIPALLVMVLLLVYLLFGSIGRGPASVESYVETVVSGGRNERQQALFALTQRIAENAQARLEGEEEPWPIDPAVLGPKLDDAWQRTEEEDHEIRYVLAALMAHLGEPEGVPRLLGLLDLSEAEDPEARLRFGALANLGALGDERALPALIRFSEDPDEGLRSVAVVGMQKLPLTEVREPLRRALGDEALMVRANAAIALSRLGDPSGAPVLRALLDPEVYEAEHERSRDRFSRGELVSQARIQALDALARLGLAEDLERVRAIAEADPDLNVRGEAKRVLEEWPTAAEAPN